MTNRSATQAKPILDDQVRELLDAVAADPLAPMHLGVLAPGGYGKTTVFKELDQIYRRAGVQVVDARQAARDSIDLSAAAVLVDDAHQLGESQLRALRHLAETEQSRLAVAYRPWPRSAALAELTEVLGRTGPQLVLCPFGPEQIRAYLTASFGTAPSAALVEFLHAQTGGIPGFVDRVASALGESATAAVHRTHFELPPSAITQFRCELDLLDADVQRFLLAAEAGAGLRIDLLSSLLGKDSEAVGEVMEAARATGLLGQDGALLPIARRAIGSLSPVERRISVRQRLVELQLQRGGSVLTVARSLLGTGAAGPTVAAAFEAAAEEVLPNEPALAAKLFAAAVTAGRPASALAVRWAQAAARSGDLDSALRLADQVIAADGWPDRAEGASVAATVLAHRGQLGRSAELYRWSGTGSSIAFATIGLAGTGRLARARELLTERSAEDPPTLLSGAAFGMAQGVHESVHGSMTAALSVLVRASALLEPAGQAVLLPDSPAALAALVALHSGELNMAESVLERAVASGMGGALMSARHRLLQAWIFLMRGKTTSAAEYLTMAREAAEPLQPRDWLFATALQVGLARRNSDLPALRRTWGHACEAVMRHPVDLFTFLPLGEFAIAAARLGDQDRLAPHLQEAQSLLGQLGNPPLWATPLHWSGLHAAIIAEQPAVAEEHAVALAGFAPHSQYCSVMSAAAESWLEVLAGKVDPIKVEAAARGLHGAGLCWDGARLAGQAAIRTSDRKAMVALLDCARLLQGRSAGQRNATAPAEDPPAGQPKATSAALEASELSEREREVADLVLTGLTYKQVGDRLFISAKTVEHHMARMRHRLGATNRSDLLARLRELISDGNGERGPTLNRIGPVDST